MTSRSNLTESGSENVFHDESEHETKFRHQNMFDHNDRSLESSYFVQFSSIKTGKL